jgi:DNA-binding NarL/FixJ family response regulator
MIRVVLVDDQELVRRRLRTLAKHGGDIAVVRGGRRRAQRVAPRA